MATVHTHPRSAYLHDVKKADPRSGLHLIRLFTRAIEENHSREPLLKHFSLSDDLVLELHSLDDFLRWGNDKIFEPQSTAKPTTKSTLVSTRTTGPSDCLATDNDEAEFRKIRELAFEQATRQHNMLEEYRGLSEQFGYGRFFPGVEVGGAEWTGAFGANDPCKLIASYIDAFFVADQTNQIKPTYRLGKTDKAIISALLKRWALELFRSDDCFPDQSQTFILSALKVSCRAWVWRVSFSFEQLDFLEIGRGVPREIVRGLVGYWCGDGEPSSHYNDGRLQEETFITQVEFIAAWLVKTLTNIGVKENFHYPVFTIVTEEAYAAIPDDIPLSVDDFLAFKRGIYYNLSEAFPFDTFELSPVLSECFYNSRETIFSGPFPFSIDDSEVYSAFDGIYDDPKFWLACISNYGQAGQLFDPYFDPYSIVKVPHPSHSALSLQDTRNSRARKRYKAFAFALDDMRESGLNELADSWWSFFIASQAYAFPGLGLSPVEITDVFKRARSCVRYDTLLPALQFSLKRAREDIDSLTSRIARSEILQLLSEVTSGPSNVHQLHSNDDPTSWLKKTLGENVWSTLSSHSQRDLVQSEQFWSRNHKLAGLDERDWGASVLNYSRVIESELNSHQADLIRMLASHGIALIDPTLGGMVALFREAYHKIRKGSEELSTSQYAVRIDRLHRAFAGKEFIIDQRNRAAHGNRQKPILIADLIRWRHAIFGQGILCDILNLRQ